MIIAGLTGGIGHGKTTFAKLLADNAKTAQHFESWEIIAEVATALRDGNNHHPASKDIASINQWLLPLADSINLCTHTATTFEKLQITSDRLAAHPEHYDKLFAYLEAVQADPTLATIEISAETKEKFRSLLQWLGGYLVAVLGSGIWYDEIVRRINYLQNQGYELVTVGGVRYPGDAERLRNTGASILEINRPNVPAQDTGDITERQRGLIEPDACISNDGSLEELAQLATVVYRDLCLHELQTSYQAAISMPAASSPEAAHS